MAQSAKQLAGLIPGGGTVAAQILDPMAAQGSKQALGAVQQKFDTGYATAAQQAPTKYAAGRRKQIGQFFKKNWLPIAGLGMGALGLMGMWRMGNQRGAAQGRPGQSQQPPAVRQQGVPEWAQNTHFQRGRAGTQRDTMLAPKMPTSGFPTMFKSFMGGAR